MTAEILHLKPHKQKTVRLSKLAAGILNRQRKTNITKAGQFKEKEKNKLLVRLNAFYLGTYIKNFPIGIYYNCTESGYGATGLYKGVNVLEQYKTLNSYFNDQGFICQITKSKCIYTNYGLKITGIYGMRKE